MLRAPRVSEKTLEAATQRVASAVSALPIAEWGSFLFFPKPTLKAVGHRLPDVAADGFPVAAKVEIPVGTMALAGGALLTPILDTLHHLKAQGPRRGEPLFDHPATRCRFLIG